METTAGPAPSGCSPSCATWSRRIVRHARVAAAQFAGRPASACRPADVCSARRRAQEPLGMLLVQPGAGHDAFRLEPDQDLDAPRVSVIADRPKPAREPLRIDLPGADLRPALLLDVPAGVHPPVVELAAFLQVAVDVHDLVLLRWPRSSPRRPANWRPRTAAAAACRPAWACCGPSSSAATGSASGAGRPARTAATISGERISSPGSSLKCVSSCPARTCRPRLVVASELGRPLTRPADDDDHALRAPLQVEVATSRCWSAARLRRRHACRRRAPAAFRSGP